MKKQDKKTNEHRLYHELSKFVVDWMKKENEKGRKPFQSEIVGALEMVKADIYALQSANRIITDRLSEILEKLNGKSITIDKNKSVIVEATKLMQADQGDPSAE